MTDKELLAQCYENVIAGKADPSYLQTMDITILLKLANRVKKYKKDREKGPVKIAVLGSYSIQHFTSLLDAFLLGQGIETDIYEGEYDGIQMDVLDPSSALYEFSPQIVIILMDDRDIKVYPECFDSEEAICSLVDSQMNYFTRLWECLNRGMPGCQILQTNIALPLTRVLGNLEGSYAFSRTDFLRRINHRLAAEHPGSVTIMDMEYLSSYAGKRQWFDYSSYFLTKTGFSPDYLGLVCAAFTRQIAAIRGKVYKCLVMDLDNTLWGGVVGDDGYDGIQLDPHNAVGEAYRFFQKYILGLKSRGVILAVCSKNEEDIAKEPFEKNPDMILSLKDIACFIANWEDKAGNIRRIATELNIGVDSLVFVDDNPAEREIVKTYVPEALVIDMPEDPAYYAQALEESGAFAWAELTKEDIKRADSYAANRERAKLMDSFVDYDEYLAALDMRAEIGSPKGAQVQRFAQLINKSNQFNLRTQRYSEAQILEMDEDENTKLIYVDLTDKFSEYGIISCIILKKQGDVCFIDTWLMSCRVLKRQVEQLAFDAVIAAAREWNCRVVKGEYIPSKKNKMVEKFYPGLGFKETAENEYEYAVGDYTPVSTKITLK